MIRIGLLATTACLALAGAASAQSLYGFGYHGTPETPWAGPYVGVHGGYAWDRNTTTRIRGSAAANVANVNSAARPATFIQDKDGYVAGGQLGWNLQKGMIVGGVEADYSATDFSQRLGRAGTTGAFSQISARYNYFATARGRLGVVLNDVLVYGTGGYATTQVRDRADFRLPNGQPGFRAAHQYEPDGYVVGGGVEYALPANITTLLGGGFLNVSKVTLRGEYLHYDFNPKRVNVSSVGSGAAGTGGAYSARFSNQADIVRTGLNFKF